jgi:Peptidase family S41
MKKTLTILFCLIILNSKGQKMLPTLTKSQMYADYDTLIMALTKINPHDYIRQTVNKYHQSDSIIALRRRIDTIASTASFFWLVNTALNYCQDGHTSIRGKSTFSNIDSLDRVKWNINISDTAIFQAYRNLYYSKVTTYKLQLPIRYINGQYITITSFRNNNQTIPANAVLTACNNLDINAYVNTLQGSLKNMHWDFTNKRFYADNFYTSLHLPPTANLDLKFVQGKKIYNLSVNLSDTVVLDKQLQYEQEGAGSVRYFSKGKILYIRIPEMRDGDFYVAKIDSLAKHDEFTKVIVDVRDNAGGSDPEWIKVITHLIDAPIVRKIVSCGNIANPRRDRWFDEPLPPVKPYYNNFLKHPVYQLIDDAADTLQPDQNSLRFKGKIYILQNENCFSSTGDLISTCQFSDQLVNIGNSTGWFAGFGSMPWVMALPNSKISYWTEPRIDFTKVSKPEDLFHNEVKIPFVPTQNDYLTRYSYKGDWYGEQFLFGYDRLFLKVISLQ